jgi:ADP-ribosylglycohydrolase
MALLLARMLVEKGVYDPQGALKEYRYWLDSRPFDCGMTISGALRGVFNPQSQANGAMMRISPLGIFGAKYALSQVAEWAVQDAALTHIHPVCQQANALFAMGIAHGIASGCTPKDLYEKMQEWARQMSLEPSLQEILHQAAEAPPGDYLRHQGWVLVAFHNALWQMLHTPSLEEALVDTVMRGGDTDTNAAICGALLGALYGLDAIPSRWSQKILNCRPQAGDPGVFRPRPECFWPVDALELAEKLLA